MKLTLTAIALVAICSTPALAEHDAMHKDMQAKHNAMIDYFFNKADINNDGVLNKIEHEAAANTMFRMADTNRDNVITRGEVKRHHLSEMRDMKRELGWTKPMRDRDGDGYAD